MNVYICIIIFIQIVFTLGIRCYFCTGKIYSTKNIVDPCVNPAKNVGDGSVSEVDCLNTKLCWKGITAGRLSRGCGEKRCAFIPDINVGSLISQTCCSNDLCNRTRSLPLSKCIIYSSTFLILFYHFFLSNKIKHL